MKRFPLLLLLLAAPALGQPNVIPGTDIALSSLSSLGSNGHTGTFPNGTVAIGMSTTACNPGTVTIPWFSPNSTPMNPNHPFIAFLVARRDRTL